MFGMTLQIVIFCPQILPLLFAVSTLPLQDEPISAESLNDESALGWLAACQKVNFTHKVYFSQGQSATIKLQETPVR